MLIRDFLLRAACVGLLVIGTGATATAQNMLVNPGFEDGPPGSGIAGWDWFGNVYTEAAAPPQFEPYEGNQLASIFGNFSGGFNVSGFFQSFPTSPGIDWQISSKSRHWSGDPMIGSQAGGGNWVVQKLAFKNAAGDEIGAAESMVLDGTFAQDVWHDNAPVIGTAPDGTVLVEAFILYLQPAFDGGAAHIDAMELYDLSTVAVDGSTWGQIKAYFGE